MAETGSDVRSGIGARLRAGREKMGLTQLQAAEKLHVDSKVVESLEAEQFEALGAPVFVRGHLKHYSELVGENGAELLELYSGSTQPVPPDLTKLPKASADSHPSRLAVPALVVLIGFVLLGLVWWVVKSVNVPLSERPKHGPQPVAIAPDVTQDPAAVASASNETAAAANGAADTASANAGSANRASTNRASAANAPARTSGTGGSGSATSAISQSSGAAARAPSGVASTAAKPAVPAANPGASAGAGAGAAAASATPASAGNKPMKVTLRFAADSWVEVYDADGQKLFYDVGSADSSRTVSGTPPLRVTFGNAPGVSLDVNGKPATVPANALNGELAHFVINRSGSIVRARPQTDGG